jgi:glycine dehydrogenase subunit 2
MEPNIYDLGHEGRRGPALPPLDVPARTMGELMPGVTTAEPDLPEVNELEAVRHFVRMSQKNYGIDVGFYPLGSCTMKYNPKINEELARLPGIAAMHPYQDESECQGTLAILYHLERLLCEIGGMDRATLQPAAGAQGEFTGLLIVRAHFRRRGERARDTVITPQSAHGTNPATAARCGFRIAEIPADDRGRVDLAALRRVADERTAAIMLTNPNTLGLFEDEIVEIAEVIHGVGGLLYCDGANMNAILSHARPGDMGFDVMHFNLHKTFSTPHGGGGPGAGPVAVKAFLAVYLPVPVVVECGLRNAECGLVNVDPPPIPHSAFRIPHYRLNHDLPHSIGKVHGYLGNFGILARAYAYIRSLGDRGLEEASTRAVLNANFLAHLLRDDYSFPYGTRCMHEFVLSAERQKVAGCSALDIAKRLMDFGVYPPTIYFPMIVKEAMMIEPTETETPETLARFAEGMQQIAREVREEPQVVREAPHVTPVGRLDEATAARKPDLVYRGEPS